MEEASFELVYGLVQGLTGFDPQVGHEKKYDSELVADRQFILCCPQTVSVYRRIRRDGRGLHILRLPTITQTLNTSTATS